MVVGILLLGTLVLLVSAVLSVLAIDGISLERYHSYYYTFFYVCFLVLRGLYFKFGFNIMNINIELKYQTVEEIIAKVMWLRRVSNTLLALYFLSVVAVPLAYYFYDSFEHETALFRAISNVLLIIVCYPLEIYIFNKFT